MPDNIIQNVSIQGEGNIVVGKGDVIIHPLPPAETRLRHNLGILLKNVETTWIKGVLEKSIHDAALLELGMELHEEAVDNPWRMVMERPDQSREEISKGRKIKDIFDEANRLLLILGEPGSGKTTTLLQLARDLIAEVDDAFTQPVPVILNLSTWTNKHQPLDEWLVLELSNKYRVPKKDGKKWLQDRRILPLFDGLDEVKVENRVACVEKINQLVDDYGLQGLVVCSRVKDYAELNVRLAFYRAIYLQPLTSDQVDDYLNQAGDKLVAVRSALQSDKNLRIMAQSPLILSIMSLAYQDAAPESLSDLSSDTGKARIKHLFDTYIAKMFNRKAGQEEYEVEQTKSRLSWLARKMQLHSQDVFLLENLQPTWLQPRLWQYVYIVVSRIFGVLIGGMFFAPVVLGMQYGYDFVVETVMFFLIFGLKFWPFGGLIFSIIDILRLEWLDELRYQKVISHFWWSVLYTAFIVLIGGLNYVVVKSFLPSGFIYLIVLDFLIRGTIGIPLFWVRGIRNNLINDIQTVEVLVWNWKKTPKGFLLGLLFSGLLGGSVGGLLTDTLGLKLVAGLLCLGPIGMMIGSVFTGLSSEVIATKTIPNQGIRMSIRNTLYGGLILGLVGGATAGLMAGLFRIRSMRVSFPYPDDGLLSGINYGLIFGVMGVLWYGGLDVIQHYTLRLILIIQGHTPRNYARFLDYAVDRIFLQKVGGGYRFIHRMLLEHFAEMYEEKNAP